MTVWLKLRGPNAQGVSPKGCAHTGWNDPSYQGIDVDAAVNAGDWVGMRLDDYVVIDCDDEATAQSWFMEGHGGWIRKTPHGYHFIYRSRHDITARKLTPKSELKTGVGHQIVFHAPGYSDEMNEGTPYFETSWLPDEVQGQPTIEEWSVVPEGMRNNFLTSVGGTLRKQGADREAVLASLLAINQEVCDPPLGVFEVKGVAKSVMRYEPMTASVIECPSCGEKIEGL